MRAAGGGVLAPCTADGGGALRSSGCGCGLGAIAAAGLDGAAALGGGATTRGLGPAGAPGATAPIAGREPGATPGGLAPGASLVFGLTEPGATAALGGAGGVPLSPGTGNALVLGKAWFGGNPPGALAGSGPFGRPAWPAPGGKPVLAAGLIAALGGTGALPCWISVALCATAGGSAGVAPPCPGATTPAWRPARPPPLSPGRAPGPPTGAAAGGGLLITLLMTARLWMLAKMMLFGGGAT